MLGDLKLSTNDYNTGQTIFFISFLSAELPSQLISKKLGPDNWIPIQMIAWSIVACCQAKLDGKASFFATRCLLGLIEGGFIPDVILYLSYFYKTKELPFRLSIFWTAYMGTNILAAFMAFGILRLRGVNGLEGWRWLFALEGALTAIIGIISWFYLPPSPTETRSWFRGKDGWFNDREEVIMVNRILRDDPSKGDMHNRQGLTPKLLWNSLKDYDLCKSQCPLINALPASLMLINDFHRAYLPYWSHLGHPSLSNGILSHSHPPINGVRHLQDQSPDDPRVLTLHHSPPHHDLPLRKDQLGPPQLGHLHPDMGVGPIDRTHAYGSGRTEMGALCGSHLARGASVSACNPGGVDEPQCREREDSNRGVRAVQHVLPGRKYHCVECE